MGKKPSLDRNLSASELDVGETLRCGRCADILPDETLTFCRSCGAPFSEVHPTNSYVLVANHKLEQKITRHKQKILAASFIIFSLFWSGFGLVSVIQGENTIRHLRPRMREVQFFIKDFKELPSLDTDVKREALYIAQRAFQDHFSLELNDIAIHEDTWPPLLKELFEETRVELQDTNANEPSSLLGIPTTKLSFWEQKVFPSLGYHWQNHANEPLQIVITNLPIFAEHGKPSSVETRHLSGSGLVSGLGHPGLVLISTYRLHNNVATFYPDRPATDGPHDEARFLGEFVIAHELGHALLGLSDYVTPPEVYASRSLASVYGDKPSTKKTPAAKDHFLRAPASIEQCLMHTDQGGGFKAWEELKLRLLGLPSTCTAYDSVTQAFALRLQAIALLKAGQREEAEKAHAEAIERAKNSTQDWVVTEWSKEHRLFLSVFQRWWRGIFMFQLKND